MNPTHQLQTYWQRIIDRLVDQEEEQWLHKKVRGLEERGHRVERATFRIKPYHRIAYDRKESIRYMLFLSLLIKDGKKVYMEEGIYEGLALLERNEIIHQSVSTEAPYTSGLSPSAEFVEKEERKGTPFSYNRREAVRYAERWWDSYNSAYKHFDLDCTNYISQCLRAGGAPTWGLPNRARGWWYTGKNWSYSWAVANSLRWYLSGSRQGLTAKEVSSADQLTPGDVICYDFEGDGRFDHNTIVVKKDSDGMPLVNAHTTNSRHRYWAYEDSTAYTPNIKYKFFIIGG
ncbi:amidase domain-containing protein [Halobacillus mangrovi]|uniref:Putative amidase domain-containing protein n=1 Tax=Halobacillus mangrovi TaxID=402384 RepID=A0A1W5ZYA7_9BACI|nr:amidase domain-containing protein [Halobacillus mangrovi]ARI78217.1 hypothetical protein HM131_15765 [Halobacillus mangrovi]